MPLDNLLYGLIETGLNKLQQLDSSAQQKRRVLDGTVFGVALKELNKPIYLIISKQKIDILNTYDWQPDCFIRLSISAIKELQNNQQLPHLIKTEQLEVEGDIQLAQQFAQLLTEMDIDWEEHLSTKVGDLLAHKLCYHGKNAKHAFISKFKNIEQHSAQFLTEEMKIAPSALEVAHFCEQVEEIETQSTRIESRINHLLNR
jgi:ubiquinone biosynthesis protein UbiJ